MVTIEIAAAFDPIGPDGDDDRDHLDEIQDMLEQLDDGGEGPFEPEPCKSVRFDLCPECRKRFAKNPLGRETAKILDFSQN